MVVEATAQAFDNPDGPLPDALKRLADDRTDQEFTISEVLGAFQLGVMLCRPILREAAKNDLERYTNILEQFDRRIIPFYLKLTDYYFTQFNHRLIRLNELMGRRNDELQQLRGKLADQVRTTSSQLAQLEKLKANVVEGISSGLMLLERSSRRILLFKPRDGTSHRHDRKRRHRFDRWTTCSISLAVFLRLNLSNRYGCMVKWDCANLHCKYPTVLRR